MSSKRECTARARAMAAAIVAMSLSAAAAHALPQSLRSREDLRDVAETFLGAMVSNQVADAYRSVGRYWAKGAGDLAAEMATVERERKELRAAIGLSLGFEAVSADEAGKRVVRLTYLERFDDGAIVWRFVFYRADAAWALLAVERTRDVRALFGDR